LKPTLICSAMPFGYGPAAKLVTLARALRGDWRLVFAGHGSALELVSRSRELFDAIVEVPAGAPPPGALLRDASVVLSLMDRDAAGWAARAQRPLVVVDSLLWMRPVVPEPLRGARGYFAQDFPGLDPTRYQPRPVVVGPIVPPRRSDAPRHGGLVVNLGGSAAPDGRQALYAAYARFVLRAVLDAGLPARFGRITVLGGAAAIAAMRELPALRDAATHELASRSHAAAREAMAGAGAVLTAPGLTATLECFHDRVPTWLLPPQNYSQWCILRRLREAGTADDALHWEDLPGAPQLQEGMLPHQTTAPVCAAIERGVGEASVAERLRARLATVGREPERVRERQTAFYRTLGPSGVETLVTALHHLRDDAGRAGGRAPRRAGRTRLERGPGAVLPETRPESDPAPSKLLPRA
jgi:hypothetical protein